MPESEFAPGMLVSDRYLVERELGQEASGSFIWRTINRLTTGTSDAKIRKASGEYHDPELIRRSGARLHRLL